MFNRHENASFMPNSAVFPGGVWEPADSCSQWQQYFQSNYLKANPTIDRFFKWKLFNQFKSAKRDFQVPFISK